jgi:outer membrane protein TolC
VLWQTNRATANNIYGLVLPQSVIPSISGPVIAADNSRSAWSSSSGLLVGWEPFDFGRRSAQVNVARSATAAASEGLNLTKLNVAAQTADAFFNLVTAEQLALIAQANVKRLQVFANAVHVLVDNKLKPGADASQADAQLAVARTQYIRARTAVEQSRAVLSQLTGIAPKSLDPDYAGLLLPAPEFDTGPGTAQNQPAARQQAAVVQQQEAQASVLDHSFAPQFQALGAVSGRGAGTDLTGNFPGGSNGLAPDTMNWALGIQVTFPAFDWFKLHAQKAVETANLRSEQARYQQQLKDIDAQTQEVQAQLAGARDIAQNTPIELQAAQQSEQQQRARFQSGLATVIDVAAAESLLTQAEADDSIARLNVWRALAALAAARGDLTPFLNQLAAQP